MLIRLLIITKIILIDIISCHPSVIIKTGGKSDEAQQEHHNADNHNVAFKVGTSGFNTEGGYNKDNENNHALAQDVGKYSEENADKKQHLDQSNFADEKFKHEGGESVADFGNKAAHKKGHHKSGFHNTYHKDESGSNSSFFDDSEDEGGQFVHNSHQGRYGDKTSQNNQGSHLDGSYKAQEDAKHGGYDKGGSYERDSGDNKNYNQEKYYNNHENGGKLNAGNEHEASRGYNEEKYHHQQPQYYEGPYYEKPQYYEKPHHHHREQTYHQHHQQPYHNEQAYYYEKPQYYPRNDYVGDYYEPVPYDAYNYPEKKTITIYEDPRVYQQSTQYKSYEKYPESKAAYGGDVVQLDVRPPIGSNVPQYYDNNYYY